ncbi:hypothetical protein BL250_06760 [Erwinia sp. OLTSP20]|uniref:ABC transporter substrate-binding protein n=1 Tax=unclassified Erwinia TaxID=2622719 RepID=UPI000C1823F8|nr:MULTISPECIES: ABC transporter substrate-binding protein [unclassified Erwinia]PIJ48587.1 hypothetical protein BV501_16595 [Erwinia sp. OAMSP11]PIJ68772.1 hypothetical protein BK416_16070 [Erwinia sp. OLSSP12]PIJ79336.1 hypothetical protein BLD47_14545 [Erwinia sp. OLCASP19]PIJ79519.1 hypothetical protein BLD46_16955 [Erwinia sp. OLMTSP26]PIJ81720.1 hypothetical protein BLD49_16210 [Erwinia sp. OLMDSP33]
MNQLTTLLLLAAFVLGFNASAEASRQITDQIGRQVTIPDKVDRVVVLQHQTLNLLVQLNAASKMVGVLANWKQELGDDYARLVPGLNQIPRVGDLTHVDAEKLVTLRPQVVFVTNYAPREMIDSISALGIPVVAISLRHDAPGERNKFNPTQTDEELAYASGLREGIKLIADIVNKPQEGAALIAAATEGHQLVSARTGNLPAAQRVRAYMANPDLTTYGSGKYTGLMMSHAGALNVAAATVKGYKQVAMEQVIAWNPQVIFVQSRFPQVVKQIENDPRWQTIDAVRQHRVWLMPEYAKAWGYPMPEALGLGELWMAKKLYPQKFSDIDMQQRVNRWYLRFYRHPYQDNHG